MNILFNVFRAILKAGILSFALFLCGQAFALPMKPDIKLLIDQAQQPKQRFVPARAGWNGPEEKSAVAEPNTTYEAMRAERTPAEMRQRLLALAMPDWRAIAALSLLVAIMRAAKSSKPRTLAPVIAFPKPAPALEEAA